MDDLCKKTAQQTNCVLDGGVKAGATGLIQLNRPAWAVMWPVATITVATRFMFCEEL